MSATREYICPICSEGWRGCGAQNGTALCKSPLPSPQDAMARGFRFKLWRESDNVGVYERIEKPAAGAKRDTRVAPSPVVTFASAIAEAPIDWLWQHRIESGALNLLAADPGSGKSLLTAAIAAVVTTGAKWPDGPANWSGTPRSVIFISSEDDPAKATRPRLRVAGANLEKVAILRTVKDSRGERQLRLQSDLGMIAAAIEQVGDAALIVIDPVDSYMGRADSNANEEVRSILEPIVSLAERTNVSVLLVKHLNKAEASPNSLYRVSGSMAYVALARTVHIVGADPDDKSRKLFVPCKISHGPKPEALAYRVTRTDDGLPLIGWEAAPVGADADDVLSGRGKAAPIDNATERAANWLRGILESEGPQPSREAAERAKASGYSDRTFDRARESLGVEAYRNREAGNIWYIRLPDGGAP